MGDITVIGRVRRWRVVPGNHHCSETTVGDSDVTIVGRVLRWRIAAPPSTCPEPPMGNGWDGGAQYGVLDSQSWSGGSGFGSLTSQSWSGGASVAGVPFVLAYPQGGAWNTSAFEFFFKAGAAPASDMTLVDLNAGSAGYMRVKLTSALHVYCEFALPHNSSTLVQSWDISTVAVSTGSWYYVTVGNPAPNNFQFFYKGNVKGPGGASLGGDVGMPSGVQSWDSTGDPHGISFTMEVGMGKSLSTSYLAFPNDASWEMSKFYLLQTGFGMLSIPVSDRSGGDIFYSGRQTSGSAAQLDDTSGNARHAAAAAQGLTINPDGPYA